MKYFILDGGGRFIKLKKHSPFKRLKKIRKLTSITWPPTYYTSRDQLPTEVGDFLQGGSLQIVQRALEVQVS